MMEEKKVKDAVSGITASEQTKRNTRNVYLFILSYFTIAIITYYSNMGENEILIHFVKYVESIIPSIHGTAAIASNANYASLMLVISWCYILPFYVLLLKSSNLENFKDNKMKNSGLLMVGSTFGLIGFLWAAIYSVPDNTGLSTKLIYNIIKSFTFGISVWGFIMWLTPSVILYGITVLIVVKKRGY